MVCGLCSATLGWMGSVIFCRTELMVFRRPRVSLMWYTCGQDQAGKSAALPSSDFCDGWLIFLVNSMGCRLTMEMNPGYVSMWKFLD